jgi:SAM-dependent methyltransferase
MYSGSKQRFSNRVADYVKFRPGYPPELMAFLREEFALDESSVVADVGSGTGILTSALLEVGCTVFAVEPNREMREAAETLLGSHARFRSVDGSAEATTLPDQSIDLVTAAQAFHWFDAPKASNEFIRVLEPGGNVALIWNDRKKDTPFLRAYEEVLLEHGCDYAQVNHRNVDDERIRAFFGGAGCGRAVFPNAQHFGWDGLYGRALSSSYVPEEGHPKHAAFATALRECFNQHARGDRVAIEYDTRVFFGPVT